MRCQKGGASYHWRLPKGWVRLPKGWFPITRGSGAKLGGPLITSRKVKGGVWLMNCNNWPTPVSPLS